MSRGARAGQLGIGRFLTSPEAAKYTEPTYPRIGRPPRDPKAVGSACGIAPEQFATVDVDIDVDTAHQQGSPAINASLKLSQDGPSERLHKRQRAPPSDSDTVSTDDDSDSDERVLKVTRPK